MSSLRILVNASTITVGGGVQVAVSFVEYATKIKYSGIKLAFIVSPAVEALLPESLRKDYRFVFVKRSPASVYHRLKVKPEILQIEKKFKPDLVYSIGFPSYVRFKSPEVGRYTNGWEICNFEIAYSSLPLSQRVLRLGKSWYRLRWAKNATYFETQTEIAKKGIIHKLKVDPDNILVLPNSVNPRFINETERVNRDFIVNDPPRIFCLAAAYRHKNLEIIPTVAKQLLEKFNMPCLFILTLPDNSDVWQRVSKSAKMLNVSSIIKNIGPLTLDKCVVEYKKADCLFLPTLAEIFSATYLEAMAMQVPIVTTNLDFAHEVCKDAALYYSPLSAMEAAKALHLVLTKPELREELIHKGSQRLKEFPDPATKHRILMDWLIELAQRSRYCEAAKTGGSP
jgi:glycosyltransferase involved in cell wall biosynthesis